MEISAYCVLCVFAIIAQVVQSSVTFRDFTGSIQCPDELHSCPVSRYYSVEGTCNNIAASWAGKWQSPYNRILPAVYDDGVNSPRERSYNHQRLPNPRLVSIKVHYPTPWTPENDKFRISHFMTVFGQFLAFDLTRARPTDVNCLCTEKNPNCINIQTTPEDILNRDQLCMITPRTISSSPIFKCEFGCREQLNMESHWLDMSQLYGSNPQINRELRDRDGLLKMNHVPGFPAPYLAFAEKDTCKQRRPQELCFKSGDSRVNSNFQIF